MICRYLRLKNACCNGLDKNKTNKKKRCVVSVMSLNTTARIDIKCHISVFYCKHTNNQFFILGTSTSKIIYFSVFWLYLNFFLTVNGSVFLGAPSQDWTWLFFLPLYYFLDAFLKKRMAPLHFFLDAFLKKRMALTTWQSEVKPCWMQSINFYIRVTVIESWWKIKFNKQKKNSSACFYSLNQHYLI